MRGREIGWEGKKDGMEGREMGWKEEMGWERERELNGIERDGSLNEMHMGKNGIKDMRDKDRMEEKQTGWEMLWDGGLGDVMGWKG